MTRKQNKILPILVLLSLLFLCVFNVSYSYFTTTAKITGSTNFGDVSLSWVEFYSSGLSNDLNVNQLYPTEALSRNGVSAIKINEGNTKPVVSLGLKNLADDVYVRFWIEVYIVQPISGKYYYVDSKGNFVDDNGNYVNSAGSSINVSSESRGDIVDYAKYFQLGSYDDEEDSFTIYDEDYTIVNGDYITYFIESTLAKGETISLSINAIKMLNTAPDDLLSSSVCVYLAYEAVQAANGAYVDVFNDDRSFIDWENRRV